MKGQWKRGWRAAAILVVTAAVGLAQTTGMAPGTTRTETLNSRPGTTVTPGAVNYVEGHATLDGQPITGSSAGSAVAEPNQVIDTSDGYVEVLLTPGAFLRLGHNSEVRFLQAGLTTVDLQLGRGSAMIEAADLVKGSDLEVAMNGVTTRIDRKGLYAFDAGQLSVRVLDGKAEVTAATGATTLKKGDEVVLAGGTPLTKRNFEVKSTEKEPLYVWSKVRSQGESAANAYLANTIVASGGWYGPGWYWDPFWAGYAFLPGSGILYSPFGFGYYAPGFFYGGYYGGGFYGRGYYGHGYYGHGYVGGVRSFQGGGFHGGGGGFHGGGGHR